MKPTLNPVLHEAASALQFIGMRDRLRCPHCQAVGTWKPHGAWIDRAKGDKRAVRRWLCKYCGYYVGPEGLRFAFPAKTLKTWRLADDTPKDERDATPITASREYYGRVVWPWRG